MVKFNKKDYFTSLKKTCPNCNHILMGSSLKEYSFYCSFCDEDFYKFEVLGALENG